MLSQGQHSQVGSDCEGDLGQGLVSVRKVGDGREDGGWEGWRRRRRRRAGGGVPAGEDS